MPSTEPEFDFEVFIDDRFCNLTSSTLTPIDNKWLLSLGNDFEDTKWRSEKFQNFVWDNIEQTALSSEERKRLAGKNHSALVEAAKKLRLTDKEIESNKGSEIGEIVLYGIMRNHFHALPVVPKIFYKQNINDYAKGADSVHIVIEGNDFSLWFGESKFYNSIEDVRLDEIVESVKKSLSTDKLKKENSIVTSLSDLDALVPDKDLLSKIKKSLSSSESIDNIKPRLNVPILLLHECSLTKGATALTDEYKQKLAAYHKERAESYFKKQIASCKDICRYAEIKFHLILFPVPEKAPIIQAFVNIAETHRGGRR